MTEVKEELKASPGEEKFARMCEERRRLGERAEEQMDALLTTLREMEGLDAPIRKEARSAGTENFLSRTPTKVLLSGWLSNRLGGRDGYAGLVRGLDADKKLPDLDRLAATK